MDRRSAQLVVRAMSGEQAAWQGLYDAHAGRVAAYFRRSGFASADSDDLLQATFVRAFRSLHTFDARKGTFRTWLGAIARNVARKQWKGRREAENFDPQLAEEIFAAADNPRTAPEAQEEAQAVRACVAALGGEHERVIRLRYVEGRSTRGIAAATGMPESTVRLRLDEARARLHRCLREKGILS